MNQATLKELSLVQNLNKLAKQLGFGKRLLSYKKLYKTSINTFSQRDASMWFFTIQLNDKNQIVGIEINTTYFKRTPQIVAINKKSSINKPISFQKAFKLVEPYI